MPTPDDTPTAARGQVEIEAPHPSSEGVSKRAATIALILILVLVFLAYLDTLWFQFVFDDRSLIVENTWLRSWHFFPRYFTSDLWRYRHPLVAGSFFRPLILTAYRMEYLLFGLRPGFWHLTAVLAHVGVTAAFYALAAHVLRDRIGALFAAAVFGLHPIQVEAAAWASGIAESLVALFMICSFLCYLRTRTAGIHRAWYLAASLLGFALALLSKEMAIVLPAIIFGCELIWGGPLEAGLWARVVHAWRAIVVVMPYVVVSTLYIALRMHALRGFQNPSGSHSILSMVMTWPSVLWFYIRHLLWPVRLSSAYDVAYVTHAGVVDFALPGMAVILVVAALWQGVKRSKRFAVATLWLVLPLLPALNLRVLLEGHFVADRYLHLPSLGFAMLVAMGLRRLRLGSAKLLGQPAVQVILATIFAVALATGVTAESAYFADQNAFFTHLATTSSPGGGGNMNLAGLLAESGHLDAAIKIYEEVLQSQPDSSSANYNLGYAYYLKGRQPDADRYLTRAVQLDPSQPESHFYLGLTRLKIGDVTTAAVEVRRAIFLRPDAEHYHFALGVIYRLQGDLPAALAEFRRELEVDPENASARQQAAEVEAAQTGRR